MPNLHEQTERPPQKTRTQDLTVCVPARNAGRTLRRTLDSILNQTCLPGEIIVCDNQSNDDTAQIAKSYAMRGVKYFFNPTPGIAEDNWNFILPLATGKLIALYHADDLYTHIMLQRQVEFLQTHPAASAVFTMTQMIDEHDRPIQMGSTRLPDPLKGQSLFPFTELVHAVLKYGNFLTVPTLMVRREALKAVGSFDSNFRSAADIDLWLRLSQWGPVGVIDEPLHRYRISGLQASAQIHRLRTTPADFFGVIDHYLSRSDVRAIVQAESLAAYEMESAADEILCAMNLLATGQEAEARTRLQKGLRLSHFFTAAYRPRRLARFLAGIGLMVGIRLGFGKMTGKGLHKFYQSQLQRRRKPVNK